MNTFVDTKYIGLLSSKLSQFKKKSGNLYNFRCPYCGDSEKSKTKARGYLILNKTFFVYKCHNCEKSTDFGSLLRYVNSDLHKEYTFEIYKNKNVYIQSDDIKKDLNLTKPVFLKGDSPLKKLKKISQLSPDHPVTKWVRNRHIQSRFHYKLFFCNRFYEWVNTFIPNKFPSLKGDHPRFVIPFLDKSNKMFALQGRAFGKEQPKYVTIKLDESKEKIYGLDRLDLNKPVNIVEGPIDSLFLDNCIAMAGADVALKIPAEQCTMIFDNEPRNEQIVNRMIDAVNKNYKVVIFPQSLKYKDINDMVLSGHDVMSMIKLNTYSGLEAKVKFNSWKKV